LLEAILVTAMWGCVRRVTTASYRDNLLFSENPRLQLCAQTRSVQRVMRCAINCLGNIV
jgi:hypothetical protein